MSLDFRVFDALDRVFHDTVVGSGSHKENVCLWCAAGGRASFQLAVARSKPEASFQIGPFSRGGRSVDFDHRVHRLLYVPVEANTSWDPLLEPVEDRPKESRSDPFVDDALDPRMEPHVLRAAPFEVAEVMAPLGARGPERRRPTVYFVAIDVDRSAPAGLYTGTLEVVADGETVTIPVQITVSKLKVPARQHLRITNWFNLKNIAKYHRLTMWSEDFWAMLRKYARLMRQYRQNVFWAPKEVVMDRGRSKRPKFNWARFDRYVRLFLDEGFDWIEGCHFADSTCADDPYQHSGDYVVSGTNLPALSIEGQEYVYRMATELWAHVKSRRWDRIYIQHVCDEPTAVDVVAYLRMANLLRQAMPGVRLMDAMCPPDLIGALDVHVPGASDIQIPGYARDPDWERELTFENFRRVAERKNCEFWLYTCCGPRGGGLNRFLDFPLLKTRLLHWLNHVEGAAGYLHWGLNMYQQGQDPFKHSVGQPSQAGHRFRLPPGDTHIVWPGDDGPWPSLRFEAMRDGIIDCELMRARAAREQGDKAVKRIVRQGVRSVIDYVPSIREFRSIHRRLLGV